MSRIDKYIEQFYDFDNSDHLPRVQPGEFRSYKKDDEVVFVEFLCPCGCNRLCNLYLVSKLHPKKNRHLWEYKQNNHLIDPSIQWTSGCMTHFYIMLDGTVEWH